MYLFKPFKTQDECDRALDKLLTHFSSDRDRIKIATFLGRIEVTKQYIKEGEVKLEDSLKLKQEREADEFVPYVDREAIEYETRKDMFKDNPINKEE